MKTMKKLFALLTVLVMLCSVSVSFAEDTAAPALESPFKTVYNTVSPSVVGIEITTNIRVQNGRVSSSSAFVGSGVVISDDGYVVTNHHVIEGAESILIKANDGEYPATLVASDAESDIAVLHADDLPVPAAPLGDSDALGVGDWALVIGNPLGEEYVNTLTVGVISGLNRVVGDTDTRMIQTDAAINSGNSGGGLFNINGELVGITSMKLSNNGYYGYAAIESIGFAIPINTIKSISSDLIEYGEVKAPSLGITCQEIASEEMEPTADFLPSSIWVREVSKKSPAEDAGLKINDLIMEADGKRITTVEELREILQSHELGDTMTLTVYRMPNWTTVAQSEPLPEGEYVTLNVEVRIFE